MAEGAFAASRGKQLDRHEWLLQVIRKQALETARGNNSVEIAVAGQVRAVLAIEVVEQHLVHAEKVAQCQRPNPTAIAVPGGGEPAQGARNPPPEAGSERVSGADENTMPPKASPLPSLAAAAAFRRAHTTPSLGSGSPAVSPVEDDTVRDLRLQLAEAEQKIAEQEKRYADTLLSRQADQTVVNSGPMLPPPSDSVQQLAFAQLGAAMEELDESALDSVDRLSAHTTPSTLGSLTSNVDQLGDDVANMSVSEKSRRPDGRQFLRRSCAARRSEGFR